VLHPLVQGKKKDLGRFDSRKKRTIHIACGPCSPSNLVLGSFFKEEEIKREEEIRKERTIASSCGYLPKIRGIWEHRFLK